MSTEYISHSFYSNCLIQAMKAKLKDWKNVKITYIPPKYGESYFFVPHFLWSDGVNDYDFGIEKHLKLHEVFFFKGRIRRRPLGWNRKYKAMRIEKYNKRADRS